MSAELAGESPFDLAVRAVRAGSSPDDQADALLAQLTTRELLGLLDGDQPQWRGLREMASVDYYQAIRAGEVTRLGIPGIRFTDGPRGILLGNATSFPAAIARAATWDPQLEQRVGDAMGKEARALGANLFAGICLNLVRHPGWGRTQESYGEDPLLLSAMGAAVTRGVRAHVMACIKHFALNSIENSRFAVDVQVDEDTLHEVYLPHFRAAVDAGADAVMSSYNAVNGEWTSGSKTLLTDILRDEWGFTGFVMTDFIWGLHDPVGSVTAGQDLEMPIRQQRARTLPKALRRGRIKKEAVVRAARHTLATELRYAARIDDAVPAVSVVASTEHRTLARTVAQRAAVLLRNEPVAGAPLLPLDRSTVRRILVVGKLATATNQGDEASSKVRPPSVSTILDGIREAFGNDRVVHATEHDAAVVAAQSADVAVVVAGLALEDEGEFLVSNSPETLSMLGFPLSIGWVAKQAAKRMKSSEAQGGDRVDLHLQQEDVDLIRAVAAANPRTIVVLIGGGAIMLEEWEEAVPAVLLAWYPGMEGGGAIADLLLGTAEPGGRLPFAIPAHLTDLPEFDPTADSVRYDEWWGQRLLDKRAAEPAYPFGFGLGYSRVEFCDPKIFMVGEKSPRATAATAPPPPLPRRTPTTQPHRPRCRSVGSSASRGSRSTLKRRNRCASLWI